MTKKFIEDIRRIAKTDELLKRIPTNLPATDKGSIGKTRGVGLAGEEVFNPCQILYSSNDGVFSFADLIDQAPGTPKIQDGSYNQCTVLNTINGMRETGTEDPNLTLTLKPDGIFLPASNLYWWTSVYTLNPYNTAGGVSIVSFRVAWTTQEKVFCDTIEECASISNDAFASEVLAIYGGSFVSSSPAEPIPFQITPDMVVASESLSTTIPAYMINLQVTTSEDTYDIWVVAMGYPKDYSFTTSMGTSAEFLTWDGSTTDPGVSMGSFATVMLNEEPNPTSFQLALIGGLWKPNPAESTAPLKYKNGVSIVTFDFGASFSRKGQIRPAKDGGFMLLETSGGVPINNTFVYRRDRTLSAIAPVSQLNTYMP